MMPVITWKKKFHTVGPAQVLTWHHETVSVIENLLPHSAYIDYVPRTVLGLRMAKLNTSSLCSPILSLWTCTGSCLLYLAEGRPGSPGQRDALDPPFPLTVSSSVSPRLLSLPLYSGWGEELWEGPPQSGLVTSYISVDGLLSLDLYFSVYMVHLNTCCFVICRARTLDLGMLSLEIAFLLRGVTDGITNSTEVGAGGMLDVSRFSNLFMGTPGKKFMSHRDPVHTLVHVDAWFPDTPFEYVGCDRIFLYFPLLCLPLSLFSHFNVPHKQSMGSLRVGHDWATSLSLFTCMHWRRQWHPTPVLLSGKSQGRGSLVGCHLWGHAESDTTEVT